MIQNFADQSTNYHFLRYFFKSNALDFTLYDLLDQTNPNNGKINKDGLKSDNDRKKIRDMVDCDNGDDIEASQGSGYPCTQGDYTGSKWWDFMRMLIDISGWMGDKMRTTDTNSNPAKDFDDAYLGSVNAFTRIFGNRLVLNANPDKAKTTPISFSVCQGGVTATELGALVKAGYCQNQDIDDSKSSDLRKRRITKPSLWSEIDGTPGKYLVACAPNEIDPACLPILVASESTTVQQTWNKGVADGSGACSYQVGFDTGTSCGPINAACDNKNCAASGGDHHLFRKSGNNAGTNVLWECKPCKKYDPSTIILYNSDPQKKHRVGCGIFAKIDSTNTQTKTMKQEHIGPLTMQHKNLQEITNQMIDSIQSIFLNSSVGINQAINAALMANDAIKDKVRAYKPVKGTCCKMH
jgi:hypothetical protein